MDKFRKPNNGNLLGKQVIATLALRLISHPTHIPGNISAIALHASQKE